ncbi:5-oxoprolinase (ATP-hydrolysing)/N-methylhydantoinase A [Humitalea rosea]|uniref:5-oxoprolinase (ATP-hydrolysing)/N-methylhydantoinase A n=1 Tax=Humitalea rosea TaxID=990373 RepID=A0A2W7JZC9_9PROT|nr:hydantoinase B/oxoprolinase family protein [Humitalea rosea]PZW40850.1 5-oxoprolinase (ATP-hydrolysing)/N-methylhydantoinase A [Humitalea rosea]
MGARYRLGFDIGGTFTDFVLFDRATGAIRLHKCLTTPQDPAEGALEGIRAITEAAGLRLSEIGELLHGTTLVTNALIERRGATLGLLTTAGFRDVLELGIEQRYDIYDLFLRFPEPLVPRRRRIEIAERIAHDGRIITALDEAAIRAEGARLVAEGCTAIAVCFLHAYANPVHEQAAGRILRAAFPGIAISLSSEVAPEIREYDRCVTTCANAFVQPLMDRYIGRLLSELADLGFAGSLRLMQSDGGLCAPEVARAYPIRLLESGPAGGALATVLFAREAGLPDAIAFDMGGTTAKACLIENGRAEIAPMMEAARVHRFKRGSGLPIKAPVVDMIEIGAGGGSIAGLDETGLLKVGPRSAGAEPGPACYGRGGTEATVTDANLLLGYYDPGFFLGGTMDLDMGACEAALGRLGQKLGLSAIEAAAGIHAIVCETMAGAARVHLVEKGRDPRRHAMAAFGGAGPAHAARVARILGVAEVLIPPASGAASALGFLAAPLAFEVSRSVVTRLGAATDWAAIDAACTALEEEARQKLRAAGVPEAAMQVARSAEMRLAGQLHQILVPLPGGVLDGTRLGEIETAFAETYRTLYTRAIAGIEIEALSLRVRVAGPEPKIVLSGAVAGGAEGKPALKGHRRAWFEGAWHETPVYDRYALNPGDTLPGPAIIEEREATTVIAPGDSLRIDAARNLRIAIGQTQAAASLVTTGMSLADACARIEADPIGLEIMWSRLISIVEEMWQTVCRTAYSLIIAESQDFANEILDPQGNPLAHSPRSMPLFNLTLTRCVKALLAEFPAETLKPGDVLVTNDPWLCAGHLFDIALVTPVFHQGRVVAVMGTVGHVSDIGGVKNPLSATEIFDEGVQIPPMKLFNDGVPDRSIFTLLRANVRNPDQVLGDVESMITANALGAQRLTAFMTEYGLDDLAALASVVQGRSEAATRAAIRAVPDGIYESEIENRPLGDVLRYSLRVHKSGDSIYVEHVDAPRQLPRGGLNCTMNVTVGHSSYPLKCMLTPNVRGNAGCYAPITVTAPLGTALNCERPAAVAHRTGVSWYIGPNLYRALAPAIPDRVQAFTGMPKAFGFYGRNTSGRLASDHFFMGGGQGASLHADGKSGLLFPTSAANTPVEMLESRMPVLVLEKGLVADTGGAGRQRGGLGQRMRARRLDGGTEPITIGLFPEGWGIKQMGLFGGQPGGGAHAGVRGPEPEAWHDVGTGEMVSLFDAQTSIEGQIAGGAGFGDPRARSLEAIAADLEDGYITAAGAARDYGCVLDASGGIDAAATLRVDDPMTTETATGRA